MMLKQVVKRLIPLAVWNTLREIYNIPQVIMAKHEQSRRFRKWMARERSYDKVRIETKLTFAIHRLEKGLSHVHFRYGFGINVLREMSQQMILLRQVDSNYNTNSLYRQGLSVLGDYRKRHENAKYDLSEIESLFLPDIWNNVKADTAHTAGSFIISSSSKSDNLNRGFVELAEGRHSVREYASTPVEQDLLDKVYQAAMKTPSVCNRQASRIYQVTDPTVIESALDIQGGFHGYAAPPVLLLITSDIRAFMNENERNEPFVDGGLFSMSLLYALEAYGLAACPLNAMFSHSQDKHTRSLLGIPDNELPVMDIAVGNFPESVPVCRSARRTVESIITRI